MVLSIILCVCLLFIFVGLLFFMETEGSWDFSAVFSGDERDEKKQIPQAERPVNGSCLAVVTVPEGEIADDTVYYNMTDCQILTSAYEVTPYGTPVHCCGYGSCTSVCPQNAITLVHGSAVVGETCNGCGICVSHCPLHLISMKQPAQGDEKKQSSWFKFWKFWFTILRRDQSDGSTALWE